jgi:uridine kinase
MTILVAIAGGTCSGKTTLTNALAERLADLRPVVLNQDAYFRDFSDAPDEMRTANRPDAVNWEALVPQLQALKRGEPIAHPVPGTRAGARLAAGDLPAHIAPAPVVLLEGHLLLVDERVRELADLKVFVDCDAEIRVLRRLTRDTSRPNASLERSLAWYWRDVLPNNQRFTNLQRTYADLIIPHDRPNPLAPRLLASCIRELLSRQ